MEKKIKLKLDELKSLYSYLNNCTNKIGNIVYIECAECADFKRVFLVHSINSLMLKLFKKIVNSILPHTNTKRISFKINEIEETTLTILFKHVTTEDPYQMAVNESILIGLKPLSKKN
jgi:hypothetical protein